MKITVEHLINMLRLFDRNAVVYISKDPHGLDIALLEGIVPTSEIIWLCANEVDYEEEQILLLPKE